MAFAAIPPKSPLASMSFGATHEPPMQWTLERDSQSMAVLRVIPPVGQNTTSARGEASPLADVVFCPTGGITLKTAMDWLSLSNVHCIGGSWVAPKDMLAKGDFGGIAANAMACSTLV